MSGPRFSSPRRRLGRALAALGSIAALAGCRGPTYAGGVVRGEGFAFRLPEPPASWRQVEHSDAAIAYRDPANDGVALFNGRCGVDGEDVPLESLTNHLFLMFTEREIALREVVPFDGREAMHTVLSAKLDGVPQSYDVWVLKKDDCVYDLIYAAPTEGFARGQPAFLAIVRGFATLPPNG